MRDCRRAARNQVTFDFKMPGVPRRPGGHHSDPHGKFSAIAGLRNLGPRSAELLATVGVCTRDDLVKLGPIGACARLLADGKPVSLNLAYAIEGALMDCDWRALPHAFRLQLVNDFRALQRGKTGARGRPETS
jgi:hypothetical protein